MSFNDFWINNNGKREKLNDTKHGVRKEQVDKKFHNLFDAYDVNGDGTLETEELEGVFVGLNRFAGADKTLDAVENQEIASLLANKANIKDADFMGFVRSVSQASQEIVSSETTPTPDGGKEVKTTYKDGTVETISYYPDGEYKFKKIDQESSTTTNYYTIGDNLDKHYTATEIESRVKKAYNQRIAQIKQDADKNKPIEGKAVVIIPNYEDFKRSYLKHFNINKGSSTNHFERHDFELSERGKVDVAVRDFVLTHYIESHKAAHDALDTMGILDDIGAAINAGAGEVWNSIKNAWKGTDEEYQNFYELAKKFEPNYNKSLQLKGTQELAQKYPENYFRGEVGKIDTENGAEFQQVTEQYQNAQILQQRLDILNKAMREISMYQSEQDALTYAPAQSEGMNPASHILNANNLLLEYFNGDKEAVNMILNGTIGNSEATIKAINGLKEDTEKLNKSVLDGKTFDQIQNDYKSQYKAMYGTDFVPDELTEKVMDAKATGGMVKLAAITAISVLITKSPIMTQMMGAAAGSVEATGAAANMIRTLTARYGATVVQQGIKFAMTSGTLATDVGLSLLNQATSERGVDGQELWESTKSSAKYIYFGSYIGAPLAQAVSRQLGKIGATARMFEGGVKTATGGIQTTTITGDKLVQNLMKGGNKVLTTGGAFLTDVAAFTGLEVITEGQDLLTAGKEQTEMLGKLKIMNHFIEYMLGGKVHAGMSKAKMDAAIENSGVKNWQIKEIKTPTKSTYEVQLEEGLPPVRFNDANELATAMMERVAGNYKGTVPTETPRELQTEVRTTTKIEVETARRDELKATLRDGKKVSTNEEINIPTGKFEAPNAKFAETDEAFRSIVTKRSADIKELDKISDIDEFCRKSFELMKEEMGLEDSDIKLEITDKDNYYDHETNTVYISRNWAGKEKGHVKGKGDKAEIFGGMAHELNHYLQWKEIILNFDSENPNWNTIISYLQQFEGAQKNIEYLIEKYPDNTELKEFFEKAKSYQDNWLNYTDAFDENGKLKTGTEYDKYKNQTVEAESFRRGDIVAEEYRKTVADVKSEETEVNPLLARLKTANDRESFVAILDEIKKLPNGEEKTRLMQEYLKQFNAWNNINSNIQNDKIIKGNRETSSTIPQESIEITQENIEKFKSLFPDKEIANDIVENCFEDPAIKAKLFENPELLREFWLAVKDKYCKGDESGKGLDTWTTCYMIEVLAKSVDGNMTSNHLQVYKKLSSKRYHYTEEEVGNVFNKLNEVNYPLVERLLTKDSQGFFRDGKQWLINLLEKVGNNNDIIDKLISKIDNQKEINYFFVTEDLIPIIEGINDYPEAAKFLQDNNIELNKPEELEDINIILKGRGNTAITLTDEQIKLFVELYQKHSNIRHFGDVIGNAIRELKPENYEKTIRYAEQFKNIHLHNIINAANKEVATEIVEFLNSDSYTKELKQNTAGKYQKEIMEMFDLNNLDNTLFEQLTQSGLSKAELLNAIKKMSKSTFKLAYDKPNQYLSGIDLKYSTPVEGKLPELPPEELARERAHIVEFFKSHMGQISRVLKYIDTDTVSHMLDKRTELFAKQLDELNELTEENFTILSEALTCKSSASGKPLSPKEKIQLCQIVEIFQRANIDLSPLIESSKNGEINLNDTKQIIQNEILKAAGVDPNNQLAIKNNKKFNEEYSYLALMDRTSQLEAHIDQIKPQFEQAVTMIRNDENARKKAIESSEAQLNNPEIQRFISGKSRKLAMEILDMMKNIDKYSDQQIVDKMVETVRVAVAQYAKSNELYTCIRESVVGDFNDFINNENNKYGQTNLKTKQAFEQQGLDYEKWISPDIEDVQLEVAGKKISIKMWDRNPQEDLFMGNKTTCCTAIGTGGNAGATPVYLLNKSYNVVELYDSNGNVVGMSRVFMGKIDDKPTLIMDNIELNKTYIKGMNDKQLKQIRDGFFNYMNQYVEQVTGSNDAQVHFYSRDIHVPSEDLESVNKVTDFIGALSQETVYVNSAGCTWIDPTKLNEVGEICWLKVPKN